MLRLLKTKSDFELCYEELGRCNLDSGRYQLWLKVNRPNAPNSPPDSPLPERYKPLQQHRSIHQFLDTPKNLLKSNHLQ